MYLIFAGTSYYASGGANDLYRHNLCDKEEVVNLANSLIGKRIKCKNDECLLDEDDECLCNGEIEWCHVYCTDFDEIIHKSGKCYGEDNGIIHCKV